MVWLQLGHKALGLRHDVERRASVRRRAHVEAVVPQGRREHRPQVLLIIDDQQFVGGHG